MRRVKLTRTKSLSPISTRRRNETARRAEVRAHALERAHGRCEAAWVAPHVPCSPVLDVDEWAGRGVDPGSHLDVDRTQVLCRRCHEAKHVLPWSAAILGLAPYPSGLLMTLAEGEPDESRVQDALDQWARQKAGRRDVHGAHVDGIIMRATRAAWILAQAGVRVGRSGTPTHPRP